jgi:hypothetical protein
MTSRSKVPSRAPLYVRALRLQQLHVGGLASFLLFECMIAIGVLLALAELVSWWAVLILPVAVAIMVKVNDAAVTAAARGRANRDAREASDDRESRDSQDSQDSRNNRDDRSARSSRSAKASSRLDEWDDWDELTAPEKHGTTSLSRAELDRESASGEAGNLRKSTPLARALARQKAQAELGEDGRSSVPMPEAPPVEPAPAKQVGVIRISVPARGKTATGRATAPQQESRRARRHENQQEHQPAARSGTYEGGSYEESDPYGRDYNQPAYDNSSYDNAGYERASYDHADYEGGDYERGGSKRGEHEHGGSERGEYEHGGSERGEYEHGGSERGGSERGGSERGGSERGGSERGGSERGGSERGGSERGEYERGGYERASYDRSYYDRPDYGHSNYDRPDYDEPHGGAHRGGYLGVNDSFHNDVHQSEESTTGGRHARGYRAGGHYADEAFTSSGGRHSENGRRDDEITRQRSTLNQGRFA